MSKRQMERQAAAELMERLEERPRLTDESGAVPDAGLLQLGRRLAAADLGAAAHKEGVMRKIRMGGRRTQPRTGRKSRYAGGIAAAVCTAMAAGVLFAQPSFASSLLDRVIATFSVGYSTMSQEEPAAEVKVLPVPESLRGQLFDAAGQPVSEIGPDTGPLFGPDGAAVTRIDWGNVVMTSAPGTDGQQEHDVLKLTDTDRLNDYTRFAVGLPAYLPEGYAFDRGEQYLDEQGNANPEYLNLYFTDAAGGSLFLQERVASRENATDGGTTDKLEQVKVNGADAVTNGTFIEWEADGVMYYLSAKQMGGQIAKEELIRIAESIRQ